MLEELTFRRVKMTSVNHSWADAHEEYSTLGILGVELRHDNIRGGLSKRVRPAHVNLVFGYQVKIGMP